MVVAAAAFSLASGIHGSVVIDPARPVCMVGVPCSAPDKNDVLAFWRHGRRIATARTDENGRFRIVLPAGRYTVTTRRQTLGRGLEPRLVTVPRGRYVRVKFTLDVGIR